MSYKETPVKTDSKSKSQGQIKTNFSEIDTLIAIDHETFDAGAEIGKHKKITLREQAGDQTTDINEMALYIKDAGLEPNLYLRKENDTTVYNLTPQAGDHGVTGSEILPSGLKIIWGVGSASQGGDVASSKTTFTDGGFATAVYQVVITKVGDGNSKDFVHIKTGTITTTEFYSSSFTRSGGDSTSVISYIAIGK